MQGALYVLGHHILPPADRSKQKAIQPLERAYFQAHMSAGMLHGVHTHASPADRNRHRTSSYSTLNYTTSFCSIAVSHTPTVTFGRITRLELLTMGLNRCEQLTLTPLLTSFRLGGILLFSHLPTRTRPLAVNIWCTWRLYA